MLTSRALVALDWRKRSGESGQLIALGQECVCLLLPHSTKLQFLLRYQHLGQPCLGPQRGHDGLFCSWFRRFRLRC
jgi:hypothetical protein